MKRLTHNKEKSPNPEKNKENTAMLEGSKQLLLKTCEELAKCSQITIKEYEKYLLEETDWRQLAKIMTKLRSALNNYYAAGGK